MTTTYEWEKKQLLRVDEVSAILGKKARTIYRLIQDGELRAYNPNHRKRGLRIFSSSLRAHLEKHTIEPDKYWE